jgi:hypothetical protein
VVRTQLALAMSLALAPMERSVSSCPDQLQARDRITRFRLNDDGTATDLRTGLTWQRCPVGTVLRVGGTPVVLGDAAGIPVVFGSDRCRPAGPSTFSWLAARLEVRRLNAARRGAQLGPWRIPDVTELRTIVEARGSGPSIDPFVFPDTPRSLFLSATGHESSPGSAWAVDFLTGQQLLHPKITTLHLRLVR